MSSTTKKEFFDMLRNGAVIGFEEEVCNDIIGYLDDKLNSTITFDEHNYRIGESFENLIEFTEFKNILATSKMQEIKGKDSDEVQARKYIEYKTLEKDGTIAILVAGVVVVTTPEIEPYYEVEAKLYVITNV